MSMCRKLECPQILNTWPDCGVGKTLRVHRGNEPIKTAMSSNNSINVCGISVKRAAPNHVSMNRIQTQTIGTKTIIVFQKLTTKGIFTEVSFNKTSVEMKGILLYIVKFKELDKSGIGCAINHGLSLRRAPGEHARGTTRARRWLKQGIF